MNLLSNISDEKFQFKVSLRDSHQSVLIFMTGSQV